MTTDTITIREVRYVPRHWRPGMPLPHWVRPKRVMLRLVPMGLGAHPTVRARVERARRRRAQNGSL